MRIHWKEQFKEDYKRLETTLKDPKPFRKALYKAVSVLQRGDDLSKIFPVNRIVPLGEGWYDCYIYSDIAMIYKIREKSVQLYAVGKASDLYKRR